MRHDGLADALTKAGVPVALAIRPRTGHGSSDSTINWLQTRFLDRYLKGRSPEAAP